MKVPVSWLREFAPIPEEAGAVGARLASIGFAVDGIEGDVLDLDVTANRPDALSVYGIAREAAAAFEVALAAPTPPALAAGERSKLPVSIGDAGCGRYALGLADVTIGPSPTWLVERLNACGVRAINNVVDVTNYVMLELGQPMHAFDAARLKGPEIRVRRARPGETLETLDGVMRKLDETTLVIADHERAVAIAGVMGGVATEVTPRTTQIALESAWFRPGVVRAASKRLGLKTEASARFERGVDPALPARAAARALSLLEDIGAGRATAGVVDVYPQAAASVVVPLSRQRMAALLGDTVPDAEVERILRALSFGLERETSGWRVQVPSFRVDVAREADLVEEVGRHWGFDRIPATFPALTTPPVPMAPTVARSRAIRRLLCGAGLQEAATFTFIEERAAAPFAPADGLVAILNPLSEKFGVLRPSLIPGLLDSLAYSRRRESADVRLFEAGTCFSPAGEAQRVGWVVTGSRGDHWSAHEGPLTLADALGIVELVAAAYRTPISAAPAEGLPWSVPGRRARIAVAGRAIGWVGQLLPALVAERGLGDTDVVFAAELDLDTLCPAGVPGIARIHALPRVPSVVRDLSIVVDERLPAAKVRDTIRSHAPSTLMEVREFDRYQGKGVPVGQVSLALRLTFRAPDRTLTDAEVQQAMDLVVSALRREHQAVLRGGEDPGGTE